MADLVTQACKCLVIHREFFLWLLGASKGQLPGDLVHCIECKFHDDVCRTRLSHSCIVGDLVVLRRLESQHIFIYWEAYLSVLMDIFYPLF